jgi:uncharacterized protein YndB with AHSA1/START domain
MNEFEIVTIIDRPVEVVFSALTDLEKMPRWNPGLAEVRPTSEGPPGLDSTVVYVGRFLGRSYESPSTYSEYVPTSRLVSVTTSGPFHLEVENSLESVGDATRLTAVYRGESRGFFKLAEPVVLRLTKKHFETATENLKELLEADAL